MTNTGTEPGDSGPVNKRITRLLRNKIHAGEYRDGEALPSTRDLARAWGTSPFTINEAMKPLTREGLIETTSRSKRVVRYTGTAKRPAHEPARPQLIVIGGYAGSGKSELGRILAHQTGWAIIDKDTITRPVVEAALELLGQSPHDRESAVYVQQVRPREYEALMAAAVENIECGASVILTAPFLTEFRDAAWMGRLRATMTTREAEVTVVWVYCDADTMHGYIRQRGAARDSGKLADWPAYLASIDLNARPVGDHHVIANCASSQPLQDQAHELLDALAIT